MMSLRILIADDHEAVREGVRVMLERVPGWEICGSATTGREAVNEATRLRPDIVILDMGMPDLTGVEAARKIKRLLPETELLIFTASESEELIREVFQAGAKSYILKADAAAHLIDAVRALSEHRPFFTSKIAEVVFAKFMDGKSKMPDAELTDREREVIQLLADGKSNKEIADAMGISVRTAETHRANLLRKLKLSSVAELVRYAIRNGMISA